MRRRLITHVKRYRTEAGLTQQELADRVDVCRETIVHLEAGRYNPSLRLAHDLSEVLGVPIVQLFEFEDDARSGCNTGPGRRP